MSAAAVLLVGLLTEIRSSAALPLLALPAVVAGLGVALFHEYLELTGKLECPAGLLGLGTAPQQSLIVFCGLLIVLLIAMTRHSPNAAGPGQITAAMVLGAFFALTTVKSAPPMPQPPTKPYDQPLEICRPPYHPG